MPPNDQNYFRSRADEERLRASQATSAEVAKIHMELAAKYDELGAMLSQTSARDDWEGLDPDEPALQNAVGQRLSAAAARIRGGLDL